MTVSYVLVTAAAVVLVEALAIGFVLPNLLSALDLQNRVTATAKDYTAEIVTTSTSPDAIILPAGFVLGHSGSTGEPGKVQSLDSGVLIPQITGTLPDRAPMALTLVLAPDGRILSSSYPGRFPVGASAYSLIPNLDLGRAGVGGQTSTLGDGRVASAIEPIFLAALRAKGASPDTKTTFAKPQAQGYVYVQAPLQTTLGTTLATAGPLLQSGLLLLLLTLPVGALFGLLTTRGLVRRLRRLESTTLAFAEGDLSRRVVPSGSDEVGQFEDHFNRPGALTRGGQRPAGRALAHLARAARFHLAGPVLYQPDPARSRKGDAGGLAAAAATGDDGGDRLYRPPGDARTPARAAAQRAR